MAEPTTPDKESHGAHADRRTADPGRHHVYESGRHRDGSHAAHGRSQVPVVRIPNIVRGVAPMPHDIPPEIADADTADLKEQPAESPYQKLGEYFLMDASQRAAALTELAAADTATRQRVQDAQLLRGLAEGKLFMKGTEEGDAFLHNQTVKDPDAIAYLISLLEETPGVPQEGKQSQHTQLTMHLTRVNEGIAEAKEAAERPRTVTGLPMRGQPRPPRTEFGTNVSESGVDTFLAHRAGPTDPQDHTNTK